MNNCLSAYLFLSRYSPNLRFPLINVSRMLDSYERGEVTPPPVSSYGGSPGLLALHSSLYATPTSRAYDIDSNIDGNESSMPIDAQIIPVSAIT